MSTQEFDQTAALARYTKLQAQMTANAVERRDLEEWSKLEKSVHQLEFEVGVEGFRFAMDGILDGSDTWSLQPMNDWEKRNFASFHSSEQATENTDAALWHVNVELPGTKLERRQYHIAILDGDQKIDVIVNYSPADKKLEVEPYVHHEMNYTVHDGCNHSDFDYYCVLDDPSSGEYQDAEMEQQYHRAVQKIMGARNKPE